MNKKKIIIISSIVLALIIIAIVVYLLLSKDKEEKRDFSGTWTLTEKRLIEEKEYEPIYVDEKIVITDNKNAIIYENDAEKCHSTIEKGEIVCLDKKYTIVENSPIGSLYLSDEEFLYRYESNPKDRVIIKEGLNVSVENWKIDLGDNKANNTMEYPSIEELNNKDFFRPKDDDYYKYNPDIDLLLEIALKIKSNKPGDYVKYTFEIVNNGDVDVNISSGAMGTDTFNVPINANYHCYTDVEYTQEYEDYPASLLESGKKLYCIFEASNYDSTKPLSMEASKSFEIKKAN